MLSLHVLKLHQEIAVLKHAMLRRMRDAQLLCNVVVELESWLFRVSEMLKQFFIAKTIHITHFHNLREIDCASPYQLS